MKAILQEWNLMRILRLVLGLVILIQGIGSKDPVSIVLGIGLGATALANIGCCGPAGCSINRRPNQKAPEDE